MTLTKEAILGWLREEDPTRLGALWAEADRTRRDHVGDAVHLRGLLELSNHCVRRCAYCGIAAPRQDLPRYRMTAEEILEGARLALALGFGTVVMQAGEDYGLTRESVAAAVSSVKRETGLAVTLSLGERSEEELRAWKEAGADRYLLRFETTDAALYERVHPSLPGMRSDRFAQLRALAAMGYEPGSGVMVGLPGQTWSTLADDLLAFADLDLDMIGVGPYIPDPTTPLGRACLEPGCPDPEFPASAGEEQVPRDELTTLKVVALARLVRPDANIPATTALATVDRERGRELGLTRGANIVMPNLTPAKYRRLYAIYPAKASSDEGPGQTAEAVKRRILALGRTLGTGPGGRRTTAAAKSEG